MHDYAWNSTLRRPRKPMNKIGPRTKAWRDVWAWLKPRMEKVGRKRCEFGFIPHDCDGSRTPAHSKKRRNMRGDDVYLVAWACLTVHRILDEVMSHEEMERAVLRAISPGGGPILPAGSTE
jgi:hypothetical protein